ncbi:MAG: hypothetical protein RMI94_09585 [Bryobacterales bacterium]|nr:hypothetical protein [Bryobacteraceae bacterium]MDW8130786.1 hypothetical protein [Bryobacterales bacterium]
MTEHLRRLLARLGRRTHPGVEDLIAAATGAGEVSLLAVYHLERCVRCRQRVASMRRQWEEVLQLTALSSEPWRSRDALLEELLALIGAWDAETSAAGPALAARRQAVHRAVARRLAGELEAQLGRLGAALAEPARRQEAPVQAMLARTGHLLSTFLGYKATVRLSQAALKLTGTAHKR